MEKVVLFGQTGQVIKENGGIMRDMDTEFMSGQRAQNI